MIHAKFSYIRRINVIINKMREKPMSTWLLAPFLRAYSNRERNFSPETKTQAENRLNIPKCSSPASLWPMY